MSAAPDAKIVDIDTQKDVVLTETPQNNVKETETAMPQAVAQTPKESITQGVDLTFNDIKYSVVEKKEVKPILKGVSGSVKSGSMMCILGPTGSGKTSLIHIVSKKLSRSNGKQISGSVRCNNVELSASQFQRISGLVTQEDIFNAALTVSETLNFAAKLKLASGHSERIATVTQKLQLEKCLKTYVGDDSNPYLKGISGGEKRRLAIAMEILDPNISLLILDEPTSGLDAAAALNVANLLRSLADTGIAVMATLHQPRTSIMSCFEDLMVLAQGRRVFCGSLDRYIPYLENTLQADVPKHENAFDFFLDALNPLIRKQSNVSIRTLPSDCDDAATILADTYESSGLRKEMDEILNQLSSLAGGPSIEDLVKSKSNDVGWIGKFIILFHRTFIIKMRDPMVLATQVSTALMLGLMFGAIYWQCYHKDKEFIILDTQMVCVMVTVMCVWLPYDVTLTFPRERQIFLRERKAGLYNTSCFYCARVSADMPMHILAATLYSLIVYPMAGLRMGAHLFTAVNAMAVLVGAAMMQMMGSVSKTFEEANILMMLVMMLSMILSSGFVREVPDFLLWAREISVMGLLADLAMYFEFKDVDSSLSTPAEVWANYGARIRDDDDMSLAFWILFSIYAVCRVITYLAVKFMYTGRTWVEDMAD